MKLIKSPLRYPGGKSKAINTIIRYLPSNFSEYREPFVGGGSIFIYLKQNFPKIDIWINDINQELFLFWKTAQSSLKDLVKEVQQIKSSSSDGRSLFEKMTTVDVEQLSDFERAVRFFILNRITFSGTVESGGYSEQAFYKRFTDSSIERLGEMKDILKDIKITNLDYSKVLKAEGKNVLNFLDPPYLSVTKSKLYGKKGDLHLSFDHHRFADEMRECKHDWLITYDDCINIRENFKSFYLVEWELQYGMNNYKQKSASKGKELIITNYPHKEEDNLAKVTTNINYSNFQQLSLFTT
ncbi:DNA adenine methylase [Nostoc sp.]|uniref:DNA adenine methylase n=1 Tax=Nostoc sp. TaxID=1180 RepID=UPI002FF44C83